jgi:pimeloyl-ACP methyl ester carboxylesterase
MLMQAKDTMLKSKKLKSKKLIIAFTMIILGSWLASIIQTDNGAVEITDIRFVGTAGQTMSALLYRPRQASADNPQPGILAVHGYINTRETQAGFAIELARRGMVVLALDQTGHGYSDPPAFAHGFGGPDGLAYLRSLAFVDSTRIGLEGHSMGGWTVLMAAAAHPDGYESMVLEGSSTGTFGTKEGTATFPRNLKLVFSQYDEFSAFMWGSAVASDIVATEKLKKLFGSDSSIEIGQLYGSIDTGTARVLSMPPVTHPGDHLSTEAIGEAVDWFNDTLNPDPNYASTNQVWYWKELGTSIALIGIFFIILPLCELLLKGPFSTIVVKAPTIHEVPRTRWFVIAFITAAIPILTFFPIQTIMPVLLPPNLVWSQSMTTGIVGWMMVTGFISLVLFGLWLKFAQHNIRFARQCGLGDIEELGKALVFAASVVFIVYLIVASMDFFFKVDFRFWVVALKSMSKMQFFQFLAYLPFFLLFFVLLSTTLHSQLGKPHASTSSMMVTNSIVLSIGFIVMLVAQYTPLFAGGSLLIASQPLLTIVALQFVPLMILVGMVSTWCFYRTGTVYPGAFVNGIFICWYVTAGQATQSLPFFN